MTAHEAKERIKVLDRQSRALDKIAVAVGAHDWEDGRIVTHVRMAQAGMASRKGYYSNFVANPTEIQKDLPF